MSTFWAWPRRAWRLNAVHKTALELAGLLTEAAAVGELDSMEEKDMASTKPTTKTTPKAKKPAKLPPKRTTPKRGAKATTKKAPPAKAKATAKKAAPKPARKAAKPDFAGAFVVHIDTAPPTPGGRGATPGPRILHGETNLLAAFYAAEHAALSTARIDPVPHGLPDTRWTTPAAELAKKLLCPLWGDEVDRYRGMAAKWFKGWPEACERIRAQFLRADKALAHPMGVHTVNALLVQVAREKGHPLYQTRAERQLHPAFIDSIDEHGVDDPIVVVYRAGVRVVVAGRQRLAAVHAVNRARVQRWHYEKKPLALLDVPVHARGLTDDAARRLMARENAQREQLSKLEEAEEALALKARGLSQRAIALELKLSLGATNNLLQLERLEQVLREQLLAGVMPLKVAYELSRLAAARQILLWKQCKDAPSPLAKLRELLSGTAPPRAASSAWWQGSRGLATIGAGQQSLGAVRRRLESQTDPRFVLLRDVFDALAGDASATAKLPIDFRLLLLDPAAVPAALEPQAQLDLEEEAHRRAREEEEADENDDYADGEDEADEDDDEDDDDEDDDDEDDAPALEPQAGDKPGVQTVNT